MSVAQGWFKSNIHDPLLIINNKRNHLISFHRMGRLNTRIMLRVLGSIHIGCMILLQSGVQGTIENERSKDFTSVSSTNRGTMHRNNHTAISFNDTTPRYIPPSQLDGSNNICKICNYTWSVPYPQHVVRGQTCSYWNNKFKPDNCLMHQSTFGAVCGCAQAPVPPCPVCQGYGDYIWTVTTSSHTSYIVDQCIQMILDLSKDDRVCSSYRLFVAKLCCTQPPITDVVSTIMNKLPTDDHHAYSGSDDYSYTGPVYDDRYIRFDDYYLAHGKGNKSAKKGPKNYPKHWKKLKKLKKLETLLWSGTCNQSLIRW